MSLTFQVPANYGYTVLVALGAIPVLSFVQGIFVGNYRKAAGVAYPNAYATAQQSKESRAAHQFNCAQRSHGQLLENMPQTMISMLVAGLTYPLVTAALGVGWLAFRIIYAYGYITAETPKGRQAGGGFWLMQGGIWGIAAYTGLRMI